jgi:hypothetical protein
MSKNSIRNFNPLAPTFAQWQQMHSIMSLAWRKGQSITIFSFAVHLRMSKDRLLSLAEGMQAQGFLSISNNRITCNTAQMHNWQVSAGYVTAQGKIARSGQSFASLITKPE